MDDSEERSNQEPEVGQAQELNQITRPQIPRESIPSEAEGPVLSLPKGSE